MDFIILLFILVFCVIIIGMYFCYIDYGNFKPFKYLINRLRPKRK